MRARWLDVKEIRRWATLRCEHCGHRFRWKRDPRSSFGNRDGKVYHGPCIAYLMWRTSAEERLAVLQLVTEVYSVDENDVTAVAALRAETPADKSTASNRVWRVFHALSKITAPSE